MVKIRNLLVPSLLLAGCISEGAEGPGGPGASGGGKADGAATTIHVPAGQFAYTLKAEWVTIDGVPTIARVPDLTPTIGAFDLDIHEATNAEWNECVADRDCKQPAEFWADNNLWLNDYGTDPQYANYPTVNVSKPEAVAYCEWRGGRLPTDEEWVKAARGGCEYAGAPTCDGEDARVFPWDADYLDPMFAVYSSTPREVGSKSPSGDSPYGAQDMIGSVAEIVDDPSLPLTDVTRGGSMLDQDLWLDLAMKKGLMWHGSNSGSGVRCAYDAP